MKKLTAWVFILACILGLVGCSSAGTKPYQNLTATDAGTKPYQNLTATDISSATVLLQPPDKTLQVEEPDRLIELLQDVVIYEEDDSYTEYAGQAVTIQLTMSDGIFNRNRGVAENAERRIGQGYGTGSHHLTCWHIAIPILRDVIRLQEKQGCCQRLALQITIMSRMDVEPRGGRESACERS